MAQVTSQNVIHDKEDYSFSDNKSQLSSIVLAQLSLEHHIPLFQKAGIDLDQFLNMTESDLINLGLDNPHDLNLLYHCSKALNLHIEQQNKRYMYHPVITEVEEEEEEAENEEDFFSMTSSRFSSRSNSTSSDDTPLMTPSSVTKAIHAFDSYHKRPPSIHVIPSVQTNTPSSSSSSSLTALVIPRPKNSNNKQGTCRPVSMPIQLPSFTTPPPDYHTSTIYGRRLDRCRSMIFPREEEGKEELPAYSCTVFKMGYVSVKKELDSPDTKSRHRVWRKLYIELWGTMLRIYRTAPTKTSSNIDYHNYYRWPLRAPYYYYHKYYYTPMFTISLAGAEASRALDYFRRPNALRLTTQQGPQFLLRLSTHVEMISWVEHLQAAINISLDLELRPMPKFITIPNRSLTTPASDPRSIELERAREQRRREQREVLI